MEDTLLIWRFKRGSSDALRRIYEKYADDMLTLAVSLLNDLSAAEDVVHDVFVAFAQSAEKIGLRGPLRSYLATCVVNLARDRIRSRKRKPRQLDQPQTITSGTVGPPGLVMFDEQLQRLSRAMARIPYEQREVIMLHLRGQTSFREIAESQGLSINTVQSRYRYGLSKLRSLLDGEVER